MSLSKHKQTHDETTATIGVNPNPNVQYIDYRVMNCQWR